jgi:cytochrome c oxidase subunit 2
LSRAFVRALRGLVPATLFLIVLACGGEYPQSSVDPRSDFAESIHSLYVLVFWITLVILMIVWGALAYILVRFRARPDQPLPRQTHGHLGLELVWTIIPAIIVIFIAIPTIQTVFATQGEVAEDALVVDVVGHQFWWEFRYPDGTLTANELHLPAGRPISLRMRSADVIHSFWIPQLGGKRDVNPAIAPPGQTRGAPEGGPPGDAQADAEPGPGDAGTYNWLHFTINEPGVYTGQCAEFCGDSHSLMGMRVVAESAADFDAWLADWRGAAAPSAPDSAAGEDEQAERAQADSIAAAQAAAGGALVDSAQIAGAGAPGAGGAARIELGRQTFHSSTCVACHAIQGTTAMGQAGPNLTMLGRRATLVGWLENNPDNLVRWITAPHSVKPSALMPGVSEMGGGFPPTNLSEEQVRAVAEYLYSLGRQP